MSREQINSAALSLVVSVILTVGYLAGKGWFSEQASALELRVTANEKIIARQDTLLTEILRRLERIERKIDEQKFDSQENRKTR